MCLEMITLSDDDCSRPCVYDRMPSCKVMASTQAHTWSTIVQSIKVALLCPLAVMAVPHRDPPSADNVRSVGSQA